MGDENISDLQQELEELKLRHNTELKDARDTNYRLHEVGIAEETKKKGPIGNN